MGACLGCLPATRDDIRKLRDDNREFQYNMETILYRIDHNVRSLCDETLCRTGKNIASFCTISIDNVGHGILVSDTRGKHLVLTAAHVAVLFLQKDTVHLQWIKSTTSAEGKVKDVFLPKQYVVDGGCDVGAIEIEIDETEDIRLLEKCISISQNPHTEGVVVGEGYENFHLRGERVQSLKQKNRLVVHAPSKPGMSGLPLFHADGMLACLIHGDSKHRGGHSESDLDRPSALLYGDYIPRGLKLFLVKKEYTNPLLRAERLSPDIAMEAPLPPTEDGVTPEYRTFCREFSAELQTVQEGTTTVDGKSVDDMMSFLANHCFDEKDFHRLDGDINVVFAVKNDGDDIEFEHEMSRGHKSSLSKPQTPSPVKRKRAKESNSQQTAGEQTME